MKIALENICKKFAGRFIFQDLTYEFNTNQACVILGPNGSGKSTLLKILSGHLRPSDGTVSFSDNDKALDAGQVFKHISFVAPYMDLPETMTMGELLSFHFRFKPCRPDVDLDFMKKEAGLAGQEDKKISNFSSGMKQKLKLIVSMSSDTAIHLLDEPCSNLDADGIAWYKHVAANHLDKGLVVVSSNNQEHEYGFCSRELHMLEYHDNH